MTLIETDSFSSNKKVIRQSELMRLIEINHFLSLEEIAERFSVTTQTARRDIAELEQRGKVRKLHGGAALATPLDPGTYKQRRTDRADEKARIANRVAELVPDGATIFLDTGTTCEAIAHALIAKARLHIVTYSLRSAAIINENTDFTLAVPGGFVRAVDGGMFQEGTPDFIRRFKFDYAIISVSGVDRDGDLCDEDHTEVAVVSCALRQSACKVLAVDSTKFGKGAMVRLGSVADVDVLISDRPPPPALNEKFEDHGVQVMLAGSGP